MSIRLLGSGLISVLGVLWATADSTTTGGLTGLGLGVANEIFAGAVDRRLDKLADQLQQGDLSNHDLTKAVGLAVATVIQAVAESKTPPDEEATLKRLAKATVRSWVEIAEEQKAAHNDLLAELKSLSENLNCPYHNTRTN